MTLFSTPSNKGRTAALLGGMGIGAALMYLLDPDRGGRRRALVRDKAARLGRLTGERFEARSRDLRNRAKGVAAKRKREEAEEPPSDDILEARVRSQMGREVRNPAAIHVSASGGRVTLTGPVPSEERDKLVACAEAVPGVETVEDRLEPHGDGSGDA